MPFCPSHRRARISGRNTSTYTWFGIASRRNVRSGSARATYFGTISPTTMWKNTTIASPTTTASVSATPFGTPNASNAFSRPRATVGSATAPSPSDAIVTPSCDDASCSGNSPAASKARRALSEPSSARPSSFVRRLAMSANSFATNTPLAARSTNASTTTHTVMTAPATASEP